ncbi:MAG: MarC family NAAT transporter [Sphingobacteriaceae bacterium]|jgi:multiple antibiotic resistance protein|nr:MarC family NAAT transporter [Sphingobacteriaceae bacterium]
MGLFIATFSALFSVVNPLGAMPVVLALTANDSPAWREIQVRKAAIYLACILIVFFLVGTYILDFFGISIEGLRIAGGIIISKSGIDLLRSKSEYSKGRAINKKVKEEALLKNDISFSPLAMPMLSGPGSISLLISLALELTVIWDYLLVIAAVLTMALVTYLILRVSPRLVSFLGESGISAMSRMMGFIVLAIGIQFIANGAIPMLKSVFNVG